MTNLIDRQAALEKIHWLGLDNDTAIKCDLAIRALPSVNPQEREVLDKIRAEIEERKKNSGGEPNRDIAFNVCLQIIDKYKAESEGTE